MISIDQLAVDYDPRPYGLDNPQPGFSWIPESEERAQSQSAYQILVASSPDNLEQDKGDMWDTGKIESDETVHIPYDGKTLQSTQRYCWKVRVWDQDDKSSPWSETAWFDMGLLSKNDWEAEWIGSGPAEEPRHSLGCASAEVVEKELGPIEVDERSTLLRREWSADKPIKRAMAYVCGLGVLRTCNDRSENGRARGGYFLIRVDCLGGGSGRHGKQRILRLAGKSDCDEV